MRLGRDSGDPLFGVSRGSERGRRLARGSPVRQLHDFPARPQLGRRSTLCSQRTTLRHRAGERQERSARLVRLPGRIEGASEPSATFGAECPGVHRRSVIDLRAGHIRRPAREHPLSTGVSSDVRSTTASDRAPRRLPGRESASRAPRATSQPKRTSSSTVASGPCRPDAERHHENMRLTASMVSASAADLSGR